MLEFFFSPFANPLLPLQSERRRPRNLALRQQVTVLQRKRPRPIVNSLDRLFWTFQNEAIACLRLGFRRGSHADAPGAIADNEPLYPRLIAGAEMVGDNWGSSGCTSTYSTGSGHNPDAETSGKGIGPQVFHGIQAKDVMRNAGFPPQNKVGMAREILDSLESYLKYRPPGLATWRCVVSKEPRSRRA